MKFHRLFFLVVISMMSFQTLCAQQNKTQKDTAKVYRAIEQYSKKRKFTSYLHRLIFEPLSKPKVKSTSKPIKKQNLKKLEGKIIRKIYIKTLDPFGYSVSDTAQKPRKRILKAGNALHMKTRDFAIHNLLMIKENEPLDSLLLRESERLIRRQRYIRSVAVIVQRVSKKSDSVDVYIRALDAWSLVPEMNLTTSKSVFTVKERNFLGTGHEFSNTYTKDLTSSNDGFGASYTVPNIKNTFITTTVKYDLDLKRNYIKSINVERPFYSPFARWAAGVYLDQKFERILPVDTPTATEAIGSKYESQDVWAGHSTPIFTENTDHNRNTNIIATARFFNRKYSEKPVIGQDVLGVYSAEKLYLFSLGISSRKYLQEKYVFNFDVVEDIATGFVYSVTSGLQNKNAQDRIYFGAKIAFGNYYSFGYIATDFEYGTFINKHVTEQSAYNFSVTYFTNLIDSRRWKFRQFVRPRAVIGTKRIDSNTDRLSLNGETGISGFNSNQLYGTKKLLLTFQMQGYSPWQLVGFRLNPYLSYTMGMLGQADTGFSRSQLFSEFGVGLIISNDYWVFSNFQVSFSYFPTLPDDMTAPFKTNSLRTYNFGLQDFEMNKPNLVNYQ
ncbi:hypothetical protein KIH23_10415 [Flavobacterium sp. CYK-55]|uniref:hypothetical protein n=1 Tax=Flavobacterium sp. CYK-55 TaxID=2835529 RepID=UPI001BCC0089|nr:hypothetical protein [Flavobacterium sp. CYK-55]MBS7787711.1 hypothetical protein [Flavobacterium sp. CYK-55]